MNVKIRSKNIESDGRGKASEAKLSDFDIRLANGELILTGKTSDCISSGERGGRMIDIEKRITIRLSPRELAQIVEKALTVTQSKKHSKLRH